MTNHNDPIIALIIAAGASRRMGRCKAELPWQTGTTLLTYQTTQWLQIGVTPVVVLAPHNAQLQQQLSSTCRTVINPSPERGKTSSILMGLATIGDSWGTLAIASVDQPRPAWVYQRLLQEHSRQPWPLTVPGYRGRRGHPLLCDRCLLPALQGIREESLGLRQIVQQYQGQTHTVEFATPLVLSDLNTPELYERSLVLID